MAVGGLFFARTGCDDSENTLDAIKKNNGIGEGIWAVILIVVNFDSIHNHKTGLISLSLTEMGSYDDDRILVLRDIPSI